MRPLLLSIFLLFISSACKEELDGECNSQFNIVVSEPDLVSTSMIQYRVYNRNDSKWWINEIAVNGKSILLDTQATNMLLDSYEYNFDSLTVRKINANTLIFTSSYNYQSNKGKIKVGVQSGKCFGEFILP